MTRGEDEITGTQSFQPAKQQGSCKRVVSAQDNSSSFVSADWDALVQSKCYNICNHEPDLPVSSYALFERLRV